MAKTHSTLLIPAPPSEVFAALLDLERIVASNPRPVEIVSVEELPNGLRKSLLRSHLTGGAEITQQNEIVERVEDELVVSRTVSTPVAFPRIPALRFGRIELEKAVRLTPDRDGTVLAMDVDWKFRPVPLHVYASIVKRDLLQRRSDAAVQRIRGLVADWPTRDSERAEWPT